MKHCWHEVDGFMAFKMPWDRAVFCCWCRKPWRLRVTMQPAPGHGPHAPEVEMPPRDIEECPRRVEGVEEPAG